MAGCGLGRFILIIQWFIKNNGHAEERRPKHTWRRSNPATLTGIGETRTLNITSAITKCVADRARKPSAKPPHMLRRISLPLSQHTRSQVKQQENERNATTNIPLSDQRLIFPIKAFLNPLKTAGENLLHRLPLLPLRRRLHRQRRSRRKPRAQWTRTWLAPRLRP